MNEHVLMFYRFWFSKHRERFLLLQLSCRRRRIFRQECCAVEPFSRGLDCCTDLRGVLTVGFCLQRLACGISVIIAAVGYLGNSQCIVVCFRKHQYPTSTVQYIQNEVKKFKISYTKSAIISDDYTKCPPLVSLWHAEPGAVVGPTLVSIVGIAMLASLLVEW